MRTAECSPNVLLIIILEKSRMKPKNRDNANVAHYIKVETEGLP